MHFSPFDGRQVSSPNPKKKTCRYRVNDTGHFLTYDVDLYNYSISGKKKTKSGKPGLFYKTHIGSRFTISTSRLSVVNTGTSIDFSYFTTHVCRRSK